MHSNLFEAHHILYWALNKMQCKHISPLPNDEHVKLDAEIETFSVLCVHERTQPVDYAWFSCIEKILFSSVHRCRNKYDEIGACVYATQSGI